MGLQSKDERISAMLDEAIAFHNEVNVRFKDNKQQYKTFSDVVLKYAKSENLVRGSVSQIFKNHPDLLQKFENFLSDSRQISFSETVSIEHQEDAKALELQTTKFLKKVSERVSDNIFGVCVLVDQLYDCVRGEFDQTKVKGVAEKYISEFSDLMEEFEEICDKYVEVDSIFLKRHGDMNNFHRLVRQACVRLQQEENAML